MRCPQVSTAVSNKCGVSKPSKRDSGTHLQFHQNEQFGDGRFLQGSLCSCNFEKRQGPRFIWVTRNGPPPIGGVAFQLNRVPKHTNEFPEWVFFFFFLGTGDRSFGYGRPGNQTIVWVSYSDLTRPHPKWWFICEISPNHLISGWRNIIIYLDRTIGHCLFGLPTGNW